jgi:hypothetical protein
VPVAAALRIDGAPETVTPLTTVIESVAELELVTLVAVTVKVVAERVTVGVPLITPVVVESVSPVGSEGVIAHEDADPPEFVGVITLIEVPVVNVNDEGLKLIFGPDGGEEDADIVRFADTKVIV